MTLSLPAATGGDGTLTYSVSGLPAGLSSSGSPPVVSGTPTTAGDYAVTYEAEDADGDTCEEEFDITITEAPTPVPTATPTPGSTRGCADDPFDLGVLDVGDTYRTGNTITYPENGNVSNQPWSDSCRASDDDQKYALFYKFRLEKEWHLTIDLHSAQDVLLRLQKKSGRWTEDDSGYPDSPPGTDARLAGRFAPGEYVIQATLKTALTGGTFRLKIDGEVPIDGWAHVHTYIPVHQADYTVQYKLGEMVQPHIPNDPSDPAIVIPSAIVNAVNAWNDAVAGTWPDVLFCKEGACPAGRNAADGDGWLTTVHVVDGKTSPKKCLSIACIRPKPTLDPDRHLLNMEIVIESPPYVFRSRVVWTTDPSRDEKAAPGGGVYRHLPTTVMHEFGHAAGLEDLYLPEYAGKYPGYLMDKAVVTAIPNKDRDYLRQIYRNEHGSEPH